MAPVPTIVGAPLDVALERWVILHHDLLSHGAHASWHHRHRHLSACRELHLVNHLLLVSHHHLRLLLLELRLVHLLHLWHLLHLLVRWHLLEQWLLHLLLRCLIQIRLRGGDGHPVLASASLRVCSTVHLQVRARVSDYLKFST